MGHPYDRLMYVKNVPYNINFQWKHSSKNIVIVELFTKHLYLQFCAKSIICMEDVNIGVSFLALNLSVLNKITNP